METVLFLEDTVHFYSYMRYMPLHLGKDLFTIETHNDFHNRNASTEISHDVAVSLEAVRFSRSLCIFIAVFLEIGRIQ